MAKRPSKPPVPSMTGARESTEAKNQAGNRSSISEFTRSADNEATAATIEDLRKLAASLERQVEQRTWCIKLLQDVAVIANEAESVEDALRRALARVCSQLGWPVGHAFLPRNDDPRTFVSSGIWYLPEPKRFAQLKTLTSRMEYRAGVGLIGTVLATGKLHWLADATIDPVFIRRDESEECAVRGAFAFPILVHNDVVGVLEFFSCDVADPDEALIEGMSQFGTQLGRVVERQRMKEEIAEASAHENRVIGQELHDTVTQEIVGIGMLADQLSSALRKSASPETTNAERIATLLREANQHIRQISHTLMPVEVQPADLQNALEMLAKNTQELHEIRCLFECPHPVLLNSGSIASHMYRIAREAVQNALRHAGATEIVIRLTAGDDLVLEVNDNGRGLKGDKADGMGLRIIRYRANLIGANVQFNGRRGKGSSVCCSVPLPR